MTCGVRTRTAPIATGPTAPCRTQPGCRRTAGVLAVAAVLAGLVSVTVGGCAYTASTLLPAHLKTLAIPVATNGTDRFGLEQQLTTSLLTAYTRDNHLRVVSGGNADAELTTHISHYRKDVFSYSSSEQPNEYQVSIVLAVVFTDRVKNREIWKNDAVTAAQRYKLTDSLGVSRPNAQTDADAAVIRQLADDVVARTVQGW